MRVSAILRLLTAITVLSAALHFSPSASIGQETADWWKAQRDATAMMLEQASIAKLATNLSATTPKNAQDAMFKLCVLMRAGLHKEAIKTLHELKTLSPDIDNYQVCGMYYDACDNLLAWEVAQAIVETFAENISEIALHNRLLKHFVRSGWTVREVDRWLADMPKGKRHFWVKERLRFNVKHGRGEAMVLELSDNVRENPQDIAGVVAFLDALIYARRRADETWDLSWMAESVKPQLATEAETIAARLTTLSKWTGAIEFYQQSLDTPLTEAEAKKLGRMYAVSVPPERLRVIFAVHVREGMATCLLKLGKTDEAQRWMVEAADMRKKHDLDRNALFAGQVQAASGQRVMEGRIRAKENASKDNPEYWQERARYYRGRGEAGQEEEALLKGLSLTTRQHDPDRQTGSHADWRGWFLADYARFLAREQRADEAVRLLREEIDATPATSESSKTAARLLAYEFDKQVACNDDVLWRWLGNRPKWEAPEERLLWRMLQNARRDDLDKHFIRAEQLAFGKDPSRASTLGWIMNRMQFPQRSIPLLKHAVENAHDTELVERTRFTLFDSYLDAGDWKPAEEIFPYAAQRLTPQELPEWYSRIAIIAAKAGAKTDAMRIWRRVANLNPSQIGSLDNLVDAGLRDELTDFYREMQKDMPLSEAPARALMVLEKK